MEGTTQTGHDAYIKHSETPWETYLQQALENTEIVAVDTHGHAKTSIPNVMFSGESQDGLFVKRSFLQSLNVTKSYAVHAVHTVGDAGVFFTKLQGCKGYLVCDGTQSYTFQGNVYADNRHDLSVSAKHMNLYASLILDATHDVYVIISEGQVVTDTDLLQACVSTAPTGWDVCLLGQPNRHGQNTGTLFTKALDITHAGPYLVSKTGATKLLANARNEITANVYSSLDTTPGLQVHASKIRLFKPIVTGSEQFFDWTYYINLDHRKDRLSEISGELAAYGLLDRSTRIPAVLDAVDGAVGCWKSHILALETFLASDFQTAVIMEDDLRWSLDPRPMVATFFNTHPVWDVVMLASNTLLESYHCSHCTSIQSAATAAGYGITRSYAAVLLDHWKSAGCSRKHACDESWRALQPGSQWFCLLPKVASQRPSYSDIEKGVYTYPC